RPVLRGWAGSGFMTGDTRTLRQKRKFDASRKPLVPAVEACEVSRESTLTQNVTPDGYGTSDGPSRNPGAHSRSGWRPESGVNRRAWFRLHDQVRPRC